jgi:hypothetical protein
MRHIRISLRTPARCTEIDFDDPETARLYIEDSVSRVLLQLLGAVIVDSVEISNVELSGDSASEREADPPGWHPP